MHSQNYIRNVLAGILRDYLCFEKWIGTMLVFQIGVTTAKYTHGSFYICAI